MDGNINGLHCGLTKVRRVYKDMGHRRQVLQDGTFHTAKEGGTN